MALIVSGVTAWLIFFRKGKLLMTQPTVIFFGPDGVRFDGINNKIYIRTLLYSTAKRGQVLESLYISVRRNESKQNFNIWVYGEKGDLKRGSGLFVPESGITLDHHFILPKDGSSFQFLEGKYNLVVYAIVVGSISPIKLIDIDLDITHSQAVKLKEPSTGIYYDWGPDQQSYYAHTDSKVGKKMPVDTLSRPNG